jgi:putative transposase
MRRLVDAVRSAWQVSVRRAFRALPFDCSAYNYRSRRPDPIVLKQRIKEICDTRVRYGYRRVHVLLEREGWAVSMKRVYRLYCEMGLQLCNKSPKRKMVAKLREDRSPAEKANQIWAMDFARDQLFNGRKICILTVVDTYSRFTPAIEARQSFKGTDVVTALENAALEVG